MTFEEWLKTHKKQQNPIGDLARDFIETGCHNIERSFEKHSPCHAVLETYKQAKRAYIIELANSLHEELCKIVDRERGEEETIWHESLDTLHNLQDSLADIENYLDDHSEEDI